MARYLGPAPCVDAILDKIASLYGSVSTLMSWTRDSIENPRE